MRASEQRSVYQPIRGRSIYIYIFRKRYHCFCVQRPILQTDCVCVYSGKNQLSVLNIALLIEQLVCVCVCVRLQTEAEQLFQSFCIPGGPNSDSVAFHSPVWVLHVHMCVPVLNMGSETYSSKAINVKCSI